MICKIEQHFGRRLKHQRQALKLTQVQLGETLGITSQQIHKYEKGVDRLAVSRLLQLSKILGVSVSFFYDGLEAHIPEKQLLISCSNSTNISIKMIDCQGIVSDVKIT
jgi:transcriptional regulator with XRE-family HTH domain